LRGVDRDWVATEPSRRLAAYTNLAPGDYLLELRAAGAKGAWSPPLQLPLHVRATWQESAWFRSALVLALIGSVAAGVHARTLYHRRRQRELEALIDERTQQLQASQRQLEQIAYYDGLTGLGNRRLFNDELKRLLAQAGRSGRGFTLLLIDLDHFKRVNDTLGHATGDAVLVAVSQGLLSAVRETDRVARLGGDEFAVLLPDTTDAVSVEAVCQRIVDALAAPLPQAGAELQPSASIGGASCPQDAQAADALYKAADVALYQAKRAGRNGWHLGAGAAVAATP
jgi:diguanylate cyclase (GGDEF)-like protein